MKDFLSVENSAVGANSNFTFLPLSNTLEVKKCSANFQMSSLQNFLNIPNSPYRDGVNFHEKRSWKPRKIAEPLKRLISRNFEWLFQLILVLIRIFHERTAEKKNMLAILLCMQNLGSVFSCVTFYERVSYAVVVDPTEIFKDIRWFSNILYEWSPSLQLESSTLDENFEGSYLWVSCRLRKYQISLIVAVIGTPSKPWNFYEGLLFSCELKED